MGDGTAGTDPIEEAWVKTDEQFIQQYLRRR